MKPHRSPLMLCFKSRKWPHRSLGGTLERLAPGLEVPMYQLFYDGDGPPKIPAGFVGRQIKEKEDWASRGTGLRQFARTRHALVVLPTQTRLPNSV
jgi:hypothetical protein